jgi:photosystem II stability/assembly factor-like uncharacterized protein
MLPRILKRAAAGLCLLGMAGSVAIADSQSPDAAAAVPPAGLAYDAVTGQLLKAEPRALYVSSDGREWTPVDLPPSVTNTRITSIAAAEDGAWYVAGEGMGVLRGADGGKTWTALNDGLPHPNVTALATHATLPETVYAVLGEGGIYRSEDAGKSWKMMDKGPRGEVLSLVHSDMAGSMQTGWLFAGTDRGVRRAMDCFCLWRPAGQLEGAVHSIAHDPREPRQIYAANRKGLHRSVDGGQTWETLGAPGKIAGLAFTPGGELYAITEEGATFRSNDGAQRWARMDD